MAELLVVAVASGYGLEAGREEPAGLADLADILAAWRAAERELEQVRERPLDIALVELRIKELRSAYHDLFEAHRRRQRGSMA